MSEWKLYGMFASHYGDGPDQSPWRAIFKRAVDGREEEAGFLYSQLSAEVARLEAARLAVPVDFREALLMMETAKDLRPLA